MIFFTFYDIIITIKEKMYYKKHYYRALHKTKKHLQAK